MGHRGYLSGEARLLVEMPYDPKTDSLGWMTFLADHGKSQILVMSQSDLALGRVSEADLDRLCRNYNRRKTGMNAVLFKPQEGAKPRLHLTTILTNSQISTSPGLDESLTKLLRNTRQFGHYIRQHMPM
jgi:hypothetical protein